MVSMTSDQTELQRKVALRNPGTCVLLSVRKAGPKLSYPFKRTRPITPWQEHALYGIKTETSNSAALIGTFQEDSIGY